jgi:SAM-dependent methyltransferase
MRGLINYDREAGRYQSGRGLSHETLDAWRRAVTEFLPFDPSPTVLDLGAGTGIFTRAWPNWCDSRVVAVEPSEGMRTEASKVGVPTGSAYIAGVGESLALRDAFVDIAWLSTVLHHFNDQDASARELERVVVPGGVLLIRGLFSDAGQIGWLDSFPGADEVRARMPSVVGTVSMLERHGFRQIGLREVIGGERETAGESAAWVRMMRTADTLLASFSDEDFRAGLTNLENLPADQPMTHSLALLALSKGQNSRTD